MRQDEGGVSQHTKAFSLPRFPPTSGNKLRSFTLPLPLSILESQTAKLQGRKSREVVRDKESGRREIGVGGGKP